MLPGDVLSLLEELDRAGCRCWVDGGWGIDALLGRQTRAHDDLDLVVGTDIEAATAVLTRAGYAVFRDWLPTAIAFRRDSDGNEVDLHPVASTPDGGGDQIQLDGITRFHYNPPVPGLIDGKTVPCCSVNDQVRCHQGYEPGRKDRQDMAALAQAFNVDLPEPHPRGSRS